MSKEAVNTKGQKKRYCLALDLKNDPELIAMYRYYHTEEGIWKEIKDGTRNAGMEMEIYNVDNRLFMICELPTDVDFDHAWMEMNKGEKNPAWEKLMQNYQQALPGRKLEWVRMDKVYEVNELTSNK
jgi:L-rhamnose mutarotase